MKHLLLLALFTFACNACATPAPTPAPSPTQPAPQPPVIVVDAAPAPQPDIDPSVRAACSNLAALQCQEGLAADCGVVLQKAFVERITIVPLDCLIGATSKPGARACGFVSCP